MKRPKSLPMVEIEGVEVLSALSSLLEDYRLRQNLTYEDVWRKVNEACEQLGHPEWKRSEASVRFCIQGRQGSQNINYRGARKRYIKNERGERVEVPTTLQLIVMVLGIPDAMWRRALSVDLMESGMSIPGIEAHMGYFTHRWADLRLHYLEITHSSVNDAGLRNARLPA